MNVPLYSWDYLSRFIVKAYDKGPAVPAPVRIQFNQSSDKW